MNGWNDLMWFRVTNFLAKTPFWKIFIAIAALGVVMMFLFEAGILESDNYMPNTNQKVINPD
jgi:hypothetical protein